MAPISDAEVEELRLAIDQGWLGSGWKFIPPERRARSIAGEAVLQSAYSNDMEAVRQILSRYPSAINFVDPATGMNALHIAVGRNHLEMARSLLEKGIAFVPDNQGRMPTTIAAECEVSDEMCDFIAEAEAKAEGV
jgi:ankyrin repeat protein